MESEHSKAMRDAIESRQADEEFQERLAASMERYQLILERLAE